MFDHTPDCLQNQIGLIQMNPVTAPLGDDLSSIGCDAAHRVRGERFGIASGQQQHRDSCNWICCLHFADGGRYRAHMGGKPVIGARCTPVCGDDRPDFARHFGDLAGDSFEDKLSV